jgi:NADPH2:quinone reductase
MKAARVHRFGDPLQVDDLPEPEAGPGEVVVALEFIGVNPVDIWVTRGTVAGGRQPLPFVPGMEAVGSAGGRRYIVRPPGFGAERDGLYRERAAVPESALRPLPEGVDPAQAAGLPVVGATAWRLVDDVAPVTAEDRVIVLGASGGVGSIVVQLAKARGAVVWGQTTNPDKAAAITSLGADRAVVATADDLADRLAELRPTVAFDPLGGAFTRALVDALAVGIGGRLALFGVSSGSEVTLDLRTLYRREVQVLTYSGTVEPPARTQAAFEAALAELAAGRIRVPVDEVLPLERAAQAHQRILEKGVRGKLLLRP